MIGAGSIIADMPLDGIGGLINRLAADQERRHAWLFDAGPVARQLNLDATKDEQMEKGK